MSPVTVDPAADKASALSPRQREALLAAQPRMPGELVVFGRECTRATCNALYMRGLVDYDMTPARVTPLGRAVLAILKGEAK